MLSRSEVPAIRALEDKGSLFAQMASARRWSDLTAVQTDIGEIVHREKLNASNLGDDEQACIVKVMNVFSKTLMQLDIDYERCMNELNLLSQARRVFVAYETPVYAGDGGE